MFVFHLALKSTPVMSCWPLPNRALVNARKIAVPLSSRSTHHWALAVVRREENFIDIFDSLPSAQYFLCLYPALVKWANSLHVIPGANNGWKKKYHIREMKHVCTEQDFGADSAVYMMGYGYNTANFKDNDGVYPKNICVIRREITDYVVNKLYPFSISTKAPASNRPQITTQSAASSSSRTANNSNHGEDPVISNHS